MLEIPNVHFRDKYIPAGKCLLEEPNSRLEPRPEITVLETRKALGGREVQLKAVTAGWHAAGSMMRWTNGHYAVHFEMGGAQHGRQYRDYESAKAYFDNLMS